MKWAFWRRDTSKRPAAPVRAKTTDTDDATADPTAALRVRARRRLIGAAALLLAAVVLIPMVLDPEPRPVADTVPIEIPSEKTPFAPRLSLPPVPDPGNVPMAPPPDTAVASADKSAETPKADAPKGEGKADEPARPEADKATAKAAPAQNAAAESRSASAPAAKPAGRILLQAAALGSDGAARELADRLRGAGFSPTTERVVTKDGVRWRVRVGPYASREDAERAREKLKGLGINAVRVAPEK